MARLASLGYGVGVKGRMWAYQKGWLSSKRLPKPTICVGNITTGGTGKTPLVIRLATDLMALRLKPAVLLRGYRRERNTARPVLVRDSQRIRAHLPESGDEAMELAARLSGCCVAVGADRHAAGTAVLRHEDVDCFILDDGFQHHRLRRDINIVALDATNPWGGGALLPAGFLRESPEALKRGDAVVLTRTAGVSPDRLNVLREQVSTYMNPGALLLESRHEPREWVRVTDGECFKLSKVKNRPVVLAAAIGNPEAFRDAVRSLDADIKQTLFLPDHSGGAGQVWQWARTRLKSDRVWLVMTEKDAMRWGHAIPKDLSARTMALRMDLEMTRGQDNWQTLLRTVKELSLAK